MLVAVPLSGTLIDLVAPFEDGATRLCTAGGRPESQTRPEPCLNCRAMRHAA